MTEQGVAGVQAVHAELRPLLGSLSAEDWERPSAAEGWRVQEVVAHITSIMKLLVDPDPTPQAEPGASPPGAEELADMMVAPRKGWSPEQVLAEYDQYLEGFLGFMAAAQQEPLASMVNDLGDLGSHPGHIFSNMFAFDHYCHLRFDLCAPEGPLDLPLSEPTDDMIRPGVEWMLAGLPAMCREALAPVLDKPLRLVLTGPGGGTWLLTPGDPLAVVTETDEGDAAATVTSTAHDFVSWGTQRSDWREACRIEGDEAYASAVLDAVNVI